MRQGNIPNGICYSPAVVTSVMPVPSILAIQTQQFLIIESNKVEPKLTEKATKKSTGPDLFDHIANHEGGGGGHRKLPHI